VSTKLILHLDGYGLCVGIRDAVSGKLLFSHGVQIPEQAKPKQAAAALRAMADVIEANEPHLAEHAATMKPMAGPGIKGTDPADVAGNMKLKTARPDPIWVPEEMVDYSMMFGYGIREEKLDEGVRRMVQMGLAEANRDWTEEQMASLIKQAILAGDFQKHVCSHPALHKLEYMPGRSQRDLLEQIRFLQTKLDQIEAIINPDGEQG
jgi:hypothetical protein